MFQKQNIKLRFGWFFYLLINYICNQLITHMESLKISPNVTLLFGIVDFQMFVVELQIHIVSLQAVLLLKRCDLNPKGLFNKLCIETVLHTN